MWKGTKPTRTNSTSFHLRSHCLGSSCATAHFGPLSKPGGSTRRSDGSPQLAPAERGAAARPPRHRCCGNAVVTRWEGGGLGRGTRRYDLSVNIVKMRCCTAMEKPKNNHSKIRGTNRGLVHFFTVHPSGFWKGSAAFSEDRWQMAHGFKNKFQEMKLFQLGDLANDLLMANEFVCVVKSHAYKKNILYNISSIYTKYHQIALWQQVNTGDVILKYPRTVFFDAMNWIAGCGTQNHWSEKSFVLLMLRQGKTMRKKKR